jgi:hypothetical protein
MLEQILQFTNQKHETTIMSYLLHSFGVLPSLKIHVIFSSSKFFFKESMEFAYFIQNFQSNVFYSCIGDVLRAALTMFSM